MGSQKEQLEKEVLFKASLEVLVRKDGTLLLQNFKTTQLRQALTWWGTIYSNYKVESKLYQPLFAGVCLDTF